MKLIDSYLSEIESYLPAAQRGDILGELRSSLEEQVLDLAGDGKPGLAEQKEVINRLGHPLKVASSYREQRYLIGPELFPTYLQTLKTVLAVVAAIQVGVLLLAYVTTGSTTSVIGMFGGVFYSLLWAASIVSVIFASIEYSGNRLDWYDDWNADSLRLSAGAPIDRSDLITNLISEAIFLLWWNNALILQNWIPGGSEILSVTLSEVWIPLHMPLNLLFGAWFLLHLFVLIRGLWHRFSLCAEMLLGGVGVAIGAWLLSQRPLLNASGVVGPDGELIIERVFATVVLVVVAVTLWDMFLAFRRWRVPRASEA